MMKGFLSIVLMIASVAALAQNVPVLGAPSLKSLEGSQELVTLRFKGSDKADANLRVHQVFPSHVVFIDESGSRVSYTYDLVSEIQVQASQVEEREFVMPKSRGLSAQDQQLLNRALSRAEQVFGGAEGRSANQDLKQKAAELLAVNHHDQALEYLRRLMDSNDLRTQLDAAERLYRVGEDVPTELVRRGLASGSRAIRAKAALLAGHVGYCDIDLNTMLRDRSAELAAPAARALARLGVRDIIPTLMEMLESTNEEMNDAAVFGLVTLGGQEVIAQLKRNLSGVALPERYVYRIYKILFELGDPRGESGLVEMLKNSPTMAPRAALLLAGKGQWNAVEYLQVRLQRKEDPTHCNLMYRAWTAAALYRGGDPRAQSVMQDLLLSDDMEVVREVTKGIAKIDERPLLNLVRPVIENVDQEVAVYGAEVLVSLARPEYRQRLVATWRDHEHSHSCLY